LERLRYGFVSDYSRGRPTSAVVDNVRRLHLNAIQFYDWMYRHSKLMPPTREFEDALGRHVSLDAVEALVGAVRGAGSLPLAYAAVYAVGADAREQWREDELLRGDGSPWTLADFLWIVDPSSERWLEHFVAELEQAMAAINFAGFHLDQYGAPKGARRRDGRLVDMAVAFAKLIEFVRDALPEAHLIFNNVNDFPTWTTAAAPQDAAYIEVWPPHDDAAHLGALADKARRLAPGRPISLAAYLSAYARGDAGALAAMRLELATVFSHGATCLLHGEADAILVDPYYVKHARMDVAGQRVAKDYYDFAVRYGDILFDSSAIDVTRSHSGGVNNEVRVRGAPVATDCVPGAVWTRVLETATRRVVSLVDLTMQDDAVWNTPKVPFVERGEISIAFERTFDSPRYFFASPEGAHGANKLEPRHDGPHDVVDVPPFLCWALVWVESRTA
jgi:dextranase